MQTLEATIIKTPSEPTTKSLTDATPMTADEARGSIDQINSGVQLIRGKLLELQRRRGWEALGYQSWKDCCEREFNSDRRRLNYMLRAAVIESDLIKAGIDQGKIFPTPDSHLRAISKAPTEKRLEAFLQLKEWEQQDGKVTEEDARLAVAAVYPNFNHELSTKLVSEFIREGNQVCKKNGVNQIFAWAEKNGKPLTNRHKEVLRYGLEEAFQATAPSNPSIDTNSGSSREASEIASAIASYEPEELARGILAAADEYGLAIAEELAKREPLAIALSFSSLDQDKLIAGIKDARLKKQQIEEISNSLFKACQEIDDLVL